MEEPKDTMVVQVAQGEQLQELEIVVQVQELQDKAMQVV